MRPIIAKQGKSKRGKWTKEQRSYVDRCIQEGCIVCRLLGFAGSEAAWHHCKSGYHAVGMRAPHEMGIALCPWHHTDGDCAIHRNPRGFEALTGKSEVELVALSMEMHGWIK